MADSNDIKIELGIKGPINDEDKIGSNIPTKESLFKNKKCLIILISIISLIVIIVAIVVIVVLTKSQNNEKKREDDRPDESDEPKPSKEPIGEIMCLFVIKKENEDIKLLGDEFTNNNANYDIYIDGEKISYSKTHKFKSIGSHNVEIIFYEDLNMDYMFKNVINLNQIEIITNKTCKILSMISTFESCTNLKDIKLTGIDLNDLKSVKKLFYNTNVNQNITKFLQNSTNIEDMSYMFAYTSIQEFNIEGINTKNVKDMSHLFEGCTSLKSVNLNHFNTNQVIKMSNMFQKCTSLKDIFINQIITEKVEDMSYMFDNCVTLVDINISNFKTNSLKDMSYKKYKY